jgi:hypothetical protein
MIESCEKKIVSADFSNTSIVHVRNSKIMERELGYTLITHGTQIPDVISQKWDKIICIYASPYMKYRAYMEILEKNPNAEMLFLVQDHDVEDNILLRNYVKATHKKYNVICNNTRKGYRHWILNKKLEEKTLNDWIDEWHVVNLNSLIFDERQVDYKFPKGDEKNGCLYFGTFRKHRAKDMAAFNGINDYVISSSTKNQDKYKLANIEATSFIDKLDWTIGNETLRQFKYSIYFEDLNTHEHYAFMANRFYECLMCDTLLFFDAKCSNTIDSARKEGYIIDDAFIVNDAAHLNEKMRKINSSDRIYKIALEMQRANIPVAAQHRKDTLDQIKSICQK